MTLGKDQRISLPQYTATIKFLVSLLINVTNNNSNFKRLASKICWARFNKQHKITLAQMSFTHIHTYKLHETFYSHTKLGPTYSTLNTFSSFYIVSLVVTFMHPRLASNSKISTCRYLLHAAIKGMCHL